MPDFSWPKTNLWVWTFEIKSKMLLDLSMVILCNTSRAPDLSNTTVCHESTPKQGANALKYLNLASDFIHEEKTPSHEATTHRYVLVPALQKNLLLNRHGIFHLGIINSFCQFSPQLPVEAKRLYKKAYLYNPKGSTLQRHLLYQVYIFSSFRWSLAGVKLHKLLSVRQEPGISKRAKQDPTIKGERNKCKELFY